MAALVKFYQFVEDVAESVHDLGGDTLKVMFTNVAPAQTDAVKTELTEITAQNGYPAGGSAVTISSSAQTTGTYKLVLADKVFTASGGSFGPFRYTVLYNDTPSSPADPLICYWDYGSAVTVLDGETFTVDFDASGGVFTLT